MSNSNFNDQQKFANQCLNVKVCISENGHGENERRDNET